MGATAPKVNPLLARIIGYGGDYFIHALTTPTTGLTFSHIKITADAVITEIKVNGTSVKASRNLNGTVPQDYLICAGADKEIDYVMLASGSAEGFIFEI